MTLEPPFTPFLFQPPSLRPYVDDLRKPTIWSVLANRIERWVYRVREPEPEPEIELPEYGPEPFGEGVDSALVEIQLALPPTLSIGRSEAELFLAALGYCACPMSFEIIGTSQSIVIQIICREHHLREVRNQLASYFPEAVLTEKRDFLSEVWERSGRYASIVDFGLRREFMVPLRIAGGFSPDPLVALVGAMSTLRDDELAVVQVLFQPVRYPWAESVLRAVMDSNGRQLFATLPELPAAARRKIGSPLYSASIRLAAMGDDEPFELLQAIGSGLAQFGSPDTNALIPLTNEDYDDIEHRDDLLARRSHRSGMLLSSEELASLVHPPSASVRSGKLIREVSRTKAAPATANGKLVLGINEHLGKTGDVSLTADERTRHMYVLGASGTGKSTFLLNLILQDIERGEGVGVLDPHGDLIDEILARIPKERLDDVVLVDPGDEEWPVGFNILQAHSELEKNLLASDLVAIFRRQSTSWGDQMNSVFANAILAFLESTRGGTLADLRRFLVDTHYRENFLPSIQDREIAYYWKREFPLLKGGGSLGPILTRLDSFLRPKLIRRMVAQKGNRINFADIMDSGKIFLARLSQGAIGEENAYLLGTLLLSKFHQIALARQGTAQEARRPFWLTVDECHHFLCPSMVSILSGVRKYKLGLTLAHQELRQLGQSEFAGSLLANPHTRICFRLGDADAVKLAAGFSFFEPKDFLNLATGQAIARIGRADNDFNLAVPRFESIEPGCATANRETIIESSRSKYAATRAEVDAALERELDALEVARKPTNGRVPKQPRTMSASVSEPTEATSHAVAPSEPLSAGPPDPLHPEVSETVAVEPVIPNPIASPEGVIHAIPRQKRTVAAAPAHLGRGGMDHKRIQNQIKLWSEGMGWRATIEQPTADGTGSVDIVMERNGCRIGCEVSVTTSAGHEIQNIRKCLAAGFDHILVLATERKHLDIIKKLALKQLEESALAKVRFCSLEELKEFVMDLTASMTNRTETVRGYRVTARYRAPNGLEGDLTKRVISDSVIKANGRQGK
ncbi:MAG: type IV secretion system DNA-binding domain-containing protein [Candidatus Sumerlaeaceae bacterium]